MDPTNLQKLLDGFREAMQPALYVLQGFLPYVLAAFAFVELMIIWAQVVEHGRGQCGWASSSCSRCSLRRSSSTSPRSLRRAFTTLSA